MTPEAIVDLAIKENLQVIAITDHNAIGNVRRAVKHAEGKPILVVPGVELSTPQGHLLIYCPTPEALEACFGKLTVSPDRKFCQNNFPQCLKEAEDQGGFGIAAHIELDTGLEKAHPKFDLFKQGVFDCKNLLGLEVNRVENSHFFTHGDEDQNRRNCVVLRCKHLNHEEKTELAKVMNSDAHSVGALGRNAQRGQEADAVQDGESHIRLSPHRTLRLRCPGPSRRSRSAFNSPFCWHEAGRRIPQRPDSEVQQEPHLHHRWTRRWQINDARIAASVFRKQSR